MITSVASASQTLDDIFLSADDTTMERLQSNPASLLVERGFIIPNDTFDEFDEFFREEIGDMKRVREDIGKGIPGYSYLQAEKSDEGRDWGCLACKISAWGLAAGLSILGAAGIAALSATSPIVGQIAGWAGVSSTVALAGTKSLLTIVGDGIKAIVNKMCSWVNACD